MKRIKFNGYFYKVGEVFESLEEFYDTLPEEFHDGVDIDLVKENCWIGFTRNNYENKYEIVHYISFEIKENGTLIITEIE